MIRTPLAVAAVAFASFVHAADCPRAFNGPEMLMQGFAAATYADMNRDGLTDLVGHNSILFNRGGGIFERGPQRSPFTALQAVHDQNGDGRLDLIHGGTGPVFEVFLAEGEGFRAPVPSTGFGLPSDDQTHYVDFDKDGVLDAIHVRIGTATFLRGAADGTFRNVASAPLDPEIKSWIRSEVGDFDGDGTLDIFAKGLLGSQFGPQRATFHLGVGGEVFGFTRVSRDFSALPYDFAVLDANGDGVGELLSLDLRTVWTLSLASGEIRLAEQKFPELRAATTSIPIGITDFDGDGVDDLLIPMHRGVGVFPRTGIANGTVTWGAPVILDLGTFAVVPSLTELDGDGRPDVVGPTSTGTAILHGGAMQTARVLPSPYKAILMTDDLDDDGDADLVMHESSNASVQRFYGDGAGGFTPGPIQELAPRSGQAGSSAALADVDGDGWSDLGWSSSFTSPAIRFGTATGFDGENVPVPVGGFSRAGRINGRNVLFAGQGDTVQLVQVSADRVVTVTPIVTLVQNQEFLFFGNIDGDDHTEIVISKYRKSARILNWNGSAWTTGPEMPWNQDLRFIAGDVTGDGKADLSFFDGEAFKVWRVQESGSVDLIASNPTRAHPTSGTNTVADFDRDGDPDIVNIAGAITAVYDLSGALLAATQFTEGETGLVLDVNRDGYPDVVHAGEALRISLNVCAASNLRFAMLPARPRAGETAIVYAHTPRQNGSSLTIEHNGVQVHSGFATDEPLRWSTGPLAAGRHLFTVRQAGELPRETTIEIPATPAKGRAVRK